ncbi:DUF4331 family protein [Kitasatospora paranensis]|uniref:DUF4331 family protein n=1 Tax=Kitasatospora paranensis TaxID=258053 RepID=UPI0031EBC322
MRYAPAEARTSSGPVTSRLCTPSKRTMSTLRSAMRQASQRPTAAAMTDVPPLLPSPRPGNRPGNRPGFSVGVRGRGAMCRRRGGIGAAGPGAAPAGRWEDRAGAVAEAGRTVVIMNVNPFAPTQGAAFHPDAVYRIDIDTDGNNRADIAYTFVFSPPRDGSETVTVHRAEGPAPGSTTPPAVPSCPMSPSTSATDRRPACRAAAIGSTPGCAATRSSPTWTASSTTSSGPATTSASTRTSALPFPYLGEPHPVKAP